MSSKALNLSAKDLTNYLQQLYSKAPASVLTFSSLLLSYLFTVSINDYRLWMSIGPGGFLKKNLIGWVAHSFLRLLGLSASQVKEANWLPQPSSKDTNQLKNLKQREGERPQVFGVVPHRQIEDLMAEGDPMKQVSLEQREGGQVDVHSEISLLLSLSLSRICSQEIISYLQQVGSSTSGLKCSRSLLENDTSPALFKNSTSSASTSLSNVYLSGTKGEFCHVHMHDGSLHLITSPTDARIILKKGWGELHPLAGLLYRSHWLGALRYTPFDWMRFRQRPNQKELRKGGAIPPTYLLIYRPRDQEEMGRIKEIIGAAISFALS